MMALSKLQSRYAALLFLLLMVAASIWLLCYPLVSVYVSQSQLMERKENQVVRFRQLAGNQETLDQELALLKRRSPAAAYYVAGETPALASARMQQYLKQIVEKNGGELISTQILGQNDQDGANSTGLKVRLTANLDASWKILYALESGRPMLFLDNLVISARPVRGRPVKGAPVMTLDMNFDMTGYLREGA